MISNDVSIKKKTGGDFKAVEGGMYQVQITDIQEREGTKYQSTEKQMQYMFKTVIVDGEEKGSGIVIFTSQSWFDGGKNAKPSMLFNLFKTIYKFYHKDVDVKTIEEVTGTMINALVGKQLLVVVELTDAGKNKVTSFMPIKKEIAHKETNEDVDVDKIPL